MISVRKRRMMLKKLNNYFEGKGKFLTEKEYMAESAVPYRLTLITKYLGGYHKLRYYISFYYPRWKLPVKKEASALETLKNSFKEKDDAE